MRLVLDSVLILCLEIILSMFDVPFLARDIQLIRDILVTVISVLVNVLRQWPFLVMLQ